MSTNITSVSAKINTGGTETEYTDFIYNEQTGYYEKTITAPNISSFLNNSENYYPVSITARDEAGNTKTVTVTDFSSLKLFVIENIPPTITISGITDGTVTNNSKPSITISVLDTNSGVSVEAGSSYVKIDNGDAIPFTLVKSDDYSATGTFTPTNNLNDGNHTYTIYAQDNDGNEKSTTVTFRIMTTTPTLTIISPNDNLVTNNNKVTIAGTTNSNTGNTIKISVDGVDLGTIALDATGSFNKEATLTSDGQHSIIVEAINAAGLSTEITRNIILDTIAPEFSEVTINPNPVNLGSATSFTIRVKVQ